MTSHSVMWYHCIVDFNVNCSFWIFFAKCANTKLLVRKSLRFWSKTCGPKKVRIWHFLRSVLLQLSVLPTNWWYWNGRASIFNHNKNLSPGSWTNFNIYGTTKVWERFVDGVFYILKPTHLEKVFYHFNDLHQVLGKR